MSEMDSFTYREAATRPGQVMFIPAGAIEQHGPHMSMNVDMLLATKMAEVVAEQVGGLVAPPLQYGYKSQQRSGGGHHLPGTTSLDGQTVTDLTKTLIKQFAQHGLRRFVVLNGHFENNYFLIEGIDLALRELGWAGIHDADIMLLSYWDFVDEATIAQLYPEGFPGWDLEHGGILETSLMLHLFPDLVDMSRVDGGPPAQMPPYDMFPIRPERTPPSGCLSSARPATAEKGGILLKAASDGIVAAIAEEWGERR
jgi:creatinine amidohydrolase